MHAIGDTRRGMLTLFQISTSQHISWHNCKIRDISNKVCIVVVRNLILNCIFRIDLIHLHPSKRTRNA